MKMFMEMSDVEGAAIFNARLDGKPVEKFDGTSWQPLDENEGLYASGIYQIKPEPGKISVPTIGVTLNKTMTREQYEALEWVEIGSIGSMETLPDYDASDVLKSRKIRRYGWIAAAFVLGLIIGFYI